MRDRREAEILARIGESVADRLRISPYFALREIRCECRDGVVTLLGQLPTHYLKQIAQEVVADVQGVTKVVNQIEVSIPGRPDAAPPSERL
jgi:osmotically-inducible protein OsmY